MKARYRSKLELYMAVLDVCQDQRIHSEVSRKCNISHYDTTRYLDYLESFEMVTKSLLKGKPRNRNVWKLTPYGLECLKKLVEVHEFFIEPTGI